MDHVLWKGGYQGEGHGHDLVDTKAVALGREFFSNVHGGGVVDPTGVTAHTDDMDFFKPALGEVSGKTFDGFRGIEGMDSIDQNQLTVWLEGFWICVFQGQDLGLRAKCVCHKVSNKLQKEVISYLGNSGVDHHSSSSRKSEIVTAFSANHAQPLVLIQEEEEYYPSRSQNIVLETEGRQVNVVLGDAFFQLQDANETLAYGNPLSLYGFYTPSEFLGLSINELSDIETQQFFSAMVYSLIISSNFQE